MEGIRAPREFSSINHDPSGIPLRVRRGLSIAEVQYTCIDAVEQFIVIGTNIGVVYWCNRKTNKIERLRPEKPGGLVTCVRIVSSVDYMVAFGDDRGVVSIFVIPKEKPAFLPAGQSSSLKNSVERFTATGIHTSAITALEWSLNGQKLFSGDEKGVIGFTQMDFCLNIIKSSEILNEKFPIVQLCYSQPHLLLIASEYRCIIYNQVGENQIHQVGLKERLNPYKLGAVIGLHSSIQGPAIFSARPKQRIWLADTNGQVCKTFLFKEALAQKYPEIELYSSNAKLNVFDNLNQNVFSKSSVNTSFQNILSDIEFCYIKVYLGELLLVYDTKGLVLLNLETNSVVGGLSLKNIVSIATYKDEIFILEGYRRIRRLALKKDPYISSNTNYYEDSPDLPIGDLLRGVARKIKEEASQNVVKPLLENLKKIEQNIIESNVSPAEEALNLNIASGQENNYLSSNNENEIINPVLLGRRSPLVSCSNKDSKESSISSSSSAALTEEETHSVPQVVVEIQPTTLHIPLKEIPQDIIPDMRSPDSIMRDVMAKEKKLACLLNFDTDFYRADTKTSPSPQDSIPSSQLCDELIPSSSLSKEFDIIIDTPEIEGIGPHEEEVNNEQNDETFNNPKEHVFHPFSEIDEAQNCCEGSWKQLILPFLPKWICVTNTKVYAGESKLVVYSCYSKTRRFHWTKQKYRAFKLAVSLSENIWWKLDPNIAYAYLHDSDKWKLTVREVNCIGVNDTSAWYICRGQIYVQLNLNREKPFSEESIKVESPVSVSKISVFNRAVWILSDQGQIFSRNQITENNPVGSSWKKLIHPESVIISDIILGCRNSGWIVDKRNDIFFTDDFDEENINWWQVIVGQHVYGNDNSLSDQLSKFINWSKESSSPTLVGSDDSTLWVVNAGENSLYVNKTAVIGHRWIPFGAGKYFKTKWKFISASGMNDETSVLWCVNRNNDIFLYRKLTEVFRPVEAPTTKEIVCITAVRNTFWLLTEDGEVFARVGISDSNPFGCFWEELNICQGSTNPLLFKLLSCGPDIVWGINDKDEIYVAPYDPSLIADSTHSTEWKRIEDLTSCDTKLIDIVVGHNKCMVWAIDVKYNVYVRQAVFEDFLFGTEWVLVPGIKAINLTISCSAVWVLTADGNIYRRFGVSSTNFIGDYWMQVPGLLSLICASPSEDLWGISKIHGRLQRYERHILGIGEDYLDKRRFSENFEDEWEIIS